MQKAVRFLNGFPWPLLVALPLVMVSASAAVYGATVALVAALTLAERRWPARSEPAPRLLNLAIWGARAVFQLTAMPLFALGISAWATRLGVPSLRIDRWPLALSAPLLVVSFDLCEYLYHRAQHTIPWLWRRHGLHHSDPCVNATTTERHWWGDLVLKAVLFMVPLSVLLRPSALDYSIYAAISLYNYFTHANLRVDFGRWSWVLNSPAYHRLHHARDPQYYGANYAALLPIFDVLLGSYRRAPGYLETGLDEAPRTVLQALAWPPSAAVDAAARANHRYPALEHAAAIIKHCQLRLLPADWKKAAVATLLAVIGVTACVLLLDCGLFRAHLSVAYVKFFTSPLAVHTPTMCLLAALEELKYRLLLMTALAFAVTAVSRKAPPSWVIVLIIFAAQFANVGAFVLADPAYASLRYLAVGSVWGWLYWRHGWVAALIGHATSHLILDPLLLIGLR